ncbi:50S ribosomal protein L28 [candidate division WOR-3 bacterium]|uniref:Large ribosomal subunit protein bL28 n=1 Tax=candidate division TA06 bacterium TaxID=2250710 RepID=A0A660S502_UNCT6|nr:50S ribosomal protein L28 [candidate division WOR-3 bacterium]RKX64601.1 MAG: 50S ribosomal protein L28 [candidate division TA06 bacterium]
MGKKCEICGKSYQMGANVSHAHNVSKKKFKANLHRVKVNMNGTVKHIYVCSKCLKANKVVKA